MEDMLARLKKEDARIKGEFALKHSNSKDKVLRSMAEGFKKSLDRILISFLKISIIIPGILALLFGVFLLFSKGGIIEENFGN